MTHTAATSRKGATCENLPLNKVMSRSAIMLCRAERAKRQKASTAVATIAAAQPVRHVSRFDPALAPPSLIFVSWKAVLST